MHMKKNGVSSVRLAPRMMANQKIGCLVDLKGMIREIDTAANHRGQTDQEIVDCFYDWMRACISI